MEPPPSPRASAGRRKKRARLDAEITVLAARLGTDWTPGDAVEPWLRRHVDELTDLVRDRDWSWADIGRALDLAGIRYASGRPWTGPHLIRKAKKARDRNARKAAAKAERTRTAAAPLADVLRAVLGASAAAPAPARQAPHPAIRSAPAPAAKPAAVPRLALDAEPADQEPEFQLVRHRSPPAVVPMPTPPASAAPAPTPAPPPKVDVDAVLRRFRGEAAPSPAKGSNDDDEGQ